MKDFYDLWALAREIPFRGDVLCAAIRATFERRATPIPLEMPVALTPVFADDRTKQVQWSAFAKRNELEVATAGLVHVTELLREFLTPPIQAVAEHGSFDQMWNPGGPWGTARQG